jgi:hypothetical protein
MPMDPDFSPKKEAADNFAHNGGHHDKVKKDEQPAHTQSLDNTGLPDGLLMREKIALQLLNSHLRANPNKWEHYQASSQVKIAFKFADEFLYESNVYRGNCELEELV